MAKQISRPARLLQASLWIYVVLIHVFAATLVWKTDFISRVRARIGHSEVHASNPYVTSTASFHRWVDGSVPPNSSIFFGDSITQGLATAAVSAHATNFGISFATTRDLVNIIPKYESTQTAKTIFLAIGINDIQAGDQSGIEERYLKILQAFPAAAHLVWSGVMPYFRSDKGRAIKETNEIVKRLCAARQKCTYIDTIELLSTNGHPDPSNFLEDGIHLNTTGYSKWIAALKAAASE